MSLRGKKQSNFWLSPKAREIVLRCAKAMDRKYSQIVTDALLEFEFNHREYLEFREKQVK